MWNADEKSLSTLDLHLLAIADDGSQHLVDSLNYVRACRMDDLPRPAQSLYVITDVCLPIVGWPCPVQPDDGRSRLGCEATFAGQSF